MIFPAICIACGKHTTISLKHYLFGNYTPSKDYKNDYTIALPVCEKCKQYIEMKKGLASKSGKFFLLFSLLGITLSILLYYFLNAIYFSIGVLVISILFPYLNHHRKMRVKIKLYDIVKTNLDSNTNTIKFSFINESYAQYLNELNSKEEPKAMINSEGD
ncbi:MAG: hypothetical protein ACFFB4_10350 [Promethearchaeota archaeon]